MKVSVLGVKQTMAFLAAKNIMINQNVKEGLGKAGRLVQNEVKIDIAKTQWKKADGSIGPSVDTGQFLNSVDMIQSDFEVIVFTPLEYPFYLEYGTSKIPPRRHFNRTLDTNKHKINEILASKVKGL